MPKECELQNILIKKKTLQHFFEAPICLTYKKLTNQNILQRLTLFRLSNHEGFHMVDRLLPQYSLKLQGL